MNTSQRLSLVGSTILSGFATLEKGASASPQQREILEAAWPSEDEGITKLAHLSRILATGVMVEDAEDSLA